jgi:hypothetical protein
MDRLRRLIAFLLIVALPIQGMASAAMLYCGMHQAPTSTMVHAAALYVKGDAASAHGKHHHGARSQKDHGKASSPEKQCPTCAAFCHAAVAVVFPGVTVPTWVTSDRSVAVADLVRERTTPPPDKPPRV